MWIGRKTAEKANKMLIAIPAIYSQTVPRGMVIGAAQRARGETTFTAEEVSETRIVFGLRNDFTNGQSWLLGLSQMTSR